MEKGGQSPQAPRVRATERGRRRRVGRKNAAGFHTLKNNGTPVSPSQWIPPHGLRAGNAVRIDKEGFGHDERVAVLATARSDERCANPVKSRTQINVMASQLALIHHECKAHMQRQSASAPSNSACS